MLKLLIIVLLLVIILCSLRNTNEGFNGLYPVHGTYCEKRGLNKSYMPQTCVLKDGCMDPHANCRCVDPKTGQCVICYPSSNKKFTRLMDEHHHKHK